MSLALEETTSSTAAAEASFARSTSAECGRFGGVTGLADDDGPFAGRETLDDLPAASNSRIFCRSSIFSIAFRSTSLHASTVVPGTLGVISFFGVTFSALLQQLVRSGSKRVPSAEAGFYVTKSDNFHGCLSIADTRD